MPEEPEVAAAEVALGEALAVAPSEVVAAAGSLSAAFAGADKTAVASFGVVVLAVPAVAAGVSSLAAREEHFAARVGFLLVHLEHSVAAWFEVAGDW